jgi:aminoglycoside phosphotransferase
MPVAIRAMCKVALMPTSPATAQRALAAARAVAAAHGLGYDQAAIVHSGSNVLVHLRPAPVVARVMTGTVALHANPRRWLEREVAVLRYLAPWQMAVRPSPLIAPGPYTHDDLWLTCWEWIDHKRQVKILADAPRLGQALRDLHDRLAAFPGELADLRDLPHDIERLLARLRPTAELTRDAIDGLRERLHSLSDAVFASSLPAQPLHGDASLTNLLWTPAGLRWNDFEDVCRGPVHWDVAGFVTSLRDRGADEAFVTRWLAAYGGGIDADELAPFLAAHDVYDKVWGLYDAQRER